MMLQIVYLFILSRVIAAQTTAPPCDTVEECIISLNENYFAHGDKVDLVCRDLQAFILCVNNISCITEEVKLMLFGQGRELVKFTCPCRQDPCLETFAKAITIDKNNQTLACRDVSDYDKCLIGLNCLSLTEIKNSVKQNQQKALGGTICVIEDTVTAGAITTSKANSTLAMVTATGAEATSTVTMATNVINKTNSTTTMISTTGAATTSTAAMTTTASNKANSSIAMVTTTGVENISSVTKSAIANSTPTKPTNRAKSLAHNTGGVAFISMVILSWWSHI